MIDRYKDLIDLYTYHGENVEQYYGRQPLSRYFTMKRAFDLFQENRGQVIVELGTIRSFVHGGLPGCNSDDTKYWQPENPESWDWSAGCFSRVAAEHFRETSTRIHTVDISDDHIRRSRVITSEFSDIISYHVKSSTDFIRGYHAKIDLVYVDTGDMTPIEQTAQHQLREAQAIVESDCVPVGGLILIDDVRNTTPLRHGDTSTKGKAKYSIPYLLSNGYKVLMDEYQVLLQREGTSGDP